MSRKYSLIISLLVILLSDLMATKALSIEPIAKSGWQGEWERVLAAAKTEGKVVVLGPPGGALRRALTEGFQKSFPGIEVEYSGAWGSRMSPRLLAERRARQYLADLHIGGTTTMLTSLIPAGVLDPIMPALILPDVTDTSKWWQGRHDFADRAGKYNLVFTANVNSPLMINPQLVKKEEIRSHWDLLDPKWRGKIAMHDPMVSGPGQGVAKFWYANPKLGKEFIRRFFAEQKVTISRNNRQILEWIIRGSKLIAVGASDTLATELKAKGLPIEKVNTDQIKEGSFLTGGFGSVGLINHAPHPNAAIVYLNWLLSKDGQTSWSKGAGYFSRRLDVPRDHLDPAIIPKEGIAYQIQHKEEYVIVRNQVRAFLKTILKR